MFQTSQLLQICNLCLSTDGPTNEIVGQGLTEMIVFVCGVKIQDHEVSPVVCEVCLNKLDKFRLFKTIAQESYNSLQDYYKNRVNSADSKFGLLEIQVLESSVDQQVKLEQEEQIDFLDISSESIKANIQDEELIPETSFGEWHCHICATSLTSQQKLRCHFKTEHSLKQNYCQDCHELFLSKHDFENHRERMHSVVVTDVEQVDRPDASHMILVNETHPVAKPSSKIEKNLDPLSQRIHTKALCSKTKRMAKSRQTKKPYTTKASLQAEPRSIFAGHQCEICEKIFVTKKCLKKHVSEHQKSI